VLVVAMLSDGAVATYVRALASGAVAALPRDAQPAKVRATVEAVIDGRIELPIDVLRSLTSSNTPTEADSSMPSPRELEWLSLLAAGVTVAALAERARYSERMMFRLLRELYKRMHVNNRTEALLLARERGWL
jgi:DNA-binding NarL/FixJ family response regulator